MKIKPFHAIFPIIGAAIAASWISLAFWDISKAAILTALSVIGAGVLVRLARGLPFSNADQFQVDEARQISKAIKQSIRALQKLFIVILSAMGCLVFTQAISNKLQLLWPILSPYADKVGSGLIGLLLAYIFVRITAVIQGDVALVDLQSDFFVKAVERKQAEKFDKQLNNSAPLAIENPEGYGKRIQ